MVLVMTGEYTRIIKDCENSIIYFKNRIKSHESEISINISKERTEYIEGYLIFLNQSIMRNKKLIHNAKLKINHCKQILGNQNGK